MWKLIKCHYNQLFVWFMIQPDSNCHIISLSVIETNSLYATSAKYSKKIIIGSQKKEQLIQSTDFIQELSEQECPIRGRHFTSIYSFMDHVKSHQCRKPVLKVGSCMKHVMTIYCLYWFMIMTRIAILLPFHWLNQSPCRQ